MPRINQYKITQTRSITISATTPGEAAQLAEAAFGQNTVERTSMTFESGPAMVHGEIEVHELDIVKEN